MGTIADKLTRIITTKEDIRKALISKGYDVPTSMPFKEYAKMILDLPCNADSFPDIEGIVARYSALGLTNEQMAENPVWKDLTGNGHDLQMKNFAWKGMSGVGGYGDENYQTFYKFTLDDYVFIASPPGVKHMNFTFRVTGLQPGNKLTLAFFLGTTNTVYGTWDKDGIYTVNSAVVEVGKPVYFYNGYGATRGEFTIEILPLYPGALVFDGVDDYGTCDNFPIFTKEKGYTVVGLRQYLFNATDKIRSLVTNSPSSIVSRSTLTFELIDSKGEKMNFSFGKGNLVSDFEPNVFSYMTSKSYNGKTITPGDVTESNERILVGNFSENGKYGSNVAIWELVFLDHDATEEELTKIKDYFVKTYPWLFPDQAWTVVGKTNEDEDRATIANITGNGNNLVLSNFGFAEGSGYGLYKTPFELYPSVQHSSKYSLSFSKFALGDHNLIIAPKQNDLSYDIKVKVTGLKDGVKFKWGWIGTTGYIDITTDGIHMLNKPASQIRQLLVEFAEDFDPDHVVTIEQIPEYEGYLITDGVDDKAVSKQFKFGENFTVILDFKFPVKKISYCGFDLSSKVRIQNIQGSGVYVVLKGNRTLIPSNVVRAVTSEGKVYDENWNEYNIVPGNISSNYTMVNLGFDGSNQFAESATKLAGIYSSTLSKDDCIKAYNYLQTLKSK